MNLILSVGCTNTSLVVTQSIDIGVSLSKTVSVVIVSINTSFLYIDTTALIASGASPNANNTGLPKTFNSKCFHSPVILPLNLV